ncbi:STN domain-containing protein [Pandoraea sp. PE-S2T-3]|uniref:STN domain-containing protein n=1 Tax=Pandoraea sp. PE-S2T-3 TaxID=1986993 RepID=UPI000B40255D|nr:STN domain-containing protein [Pandoraea sp. PE-S2T-3]
MAFAHIPRQRYTKFGYPCLYIGWLLAALCHVSFAADGGHPIELPDADKPRRFDIGRMPLREALEGFFRVTGHSLLYDDALTAGKRTGPLMGEFTPEAALRTLLSGTGLVARRTAPNAWVLFDTSSRAGDSDISSSAPDVYQVGPEATTQATRYYATLQTAIARTLCMDPMTAPGHYRMALRVWIGADNVIEKVLLHPTGDAGRDSRVQSRLRGLHLTSAMPKGVVSPMTLVILPRSPADSGDCASSTEPKAMSTSVPLSAFDISTMPDVPRTAWPLTLAAP